MPIDWTWVPGENSRTQPQRSEEAIRDIFRSANVLFRDCEEEWPIMMRARDGWGQMLPYAAIALGADYPSMKPDYAAKWRAQKARFEKFCVAADLTVSTSYDYASGHYRTTLYLHPEPWAHRMVHRYPCLEDPDAT